MKKLLIGLTFLCWLTGVKGQAPHSIAVNLYGSYIFQDRIDFDGFTGYARDGFQYGVGLEYFIEAARSMDLKYLRHSTRFPLYGPAGTKLNEKDDKGSVNYILLGGTNYFGGNSQSKAQPFAGFGLGVGILDSKEGGNTTHFAWDTKLGVRVKSSSKISIKLQATLQSVISGAGSDLYAYPGGAVIAVPDYATLLQFGLGGGLCFSF